MPPGPLDTASLTATLRQATRLCAQGRPEQALALAKQAAAQSPRSADAQFTLGSVYQSMGSPIASIKHLRRAVRMSPGNAPFRAGLATALVRAGKTAEGLREADLALDTNPHDPRSIELKGSLLRTLGRFEEAREHLERALDHARTPRLLCAYVKTLRALKQHERAAQICRELLALDSISERDRVTAGFDLASALDALGEYEDAWSAAERANALHTGVYDPEANAAWTDEVIRLWTPERMGSLPTSGLEAPMQTFIVGMPRSGTTLIEQIIAAHPRGAGAGERQDIPLAWGELIEPTNEKPTRDSMMRALSQGPLRKLASAYMTSLLESTPGRSVSRIADKQMRNARYLGLIRLMFPGARIIECRRHPLDTLVSCYFNDFGDPANLGYVYDVEHIAHEYTLTRRLLEHWRRVCRLPTHDAYYERFTGEPERETRALIEFLGLDWDDACLSFHEADRAVITLSFDQVRRPMYRSSVERWKHYERHLDPAIEILGDLVP